LSWTATWWLLCLFRPSSISLSFSWWITNGRFFSSFGSIFRTQLYENNSNTTGWNDYKGCPTWANNKEDFCSLFTSWISVTIINAFGSLVCWHVLVEPTIEYHIFLFEGASPLKRFQSILSSNPRGFQPKLAIWDPIDGNKLNGISRFNLFISANYGGILFRNRGSTIADRGYESLWPAL
jgi:hypothetical protein